MLTIPMRMLLLAIAGWLNEELRERIEFLQEQVRVLQELQGGKRLRLTDDQRRRLAVKGKRLGRRVLRELATIVTPEPNGNGTVTLHSGVELQLSRRYRDAVASRLGIEF